MRGGRAERNRAGAGLLWERCGRLELAVRVGGKLRAPRKLSIRDLVKTATALAKLESGPCRVRWSAGRPRPAGSVAVVSQMPKSIEVRTAVPSSGATANL